MALVLAKVNGRKFRLEFEMPLSGEGGVAIDTIFSLVPQTQTLVADTDTILPAGPRIHVSSAGNRKLTSTPSIAAGTVVGEEIQIVNTGTKWFMLQGSSLVGSGVKLRSGAITLASDCSLHLVWDGTNWVEIQRATYGTAERVSVKDFGAVGDGVADDTAAVVAAVAGAITDGCRHIHFPQGTFRITAVGLSTNSPAVLIPSNFVVTGEGPSSILRWEGDTHGGGGDFPLDPYYFCFYTADSTVNVLFEGLHFVGQNGTGATGFVYLLNAQSVCIYAFGTASSDIIVRSCAFDNMWGFSIHMDSPQRGAVIDCDTRYCANGINVNSHYSVQSHNRIFHSEGFEAAGRGIVISDNTIADALTGAISCGGTYSPPGGGGFYRTPGCIVSGNVIDGCTGIGIVCTDGFVNAIVSGNSVRHCDGGGILVSPDPGDNIVEGSIISNNTVTDNCAPGNPNVWGISLGGIGKHVCFGNRVVNDDVAWGQQYPIFVDAPSCHVFGNYLDGTNEDIGLGTGATNTYLADNVYVNQKVQFLAGSTRFPITRYGRAANEVIEASALSNGIQGPGFYKFVRTADGTMRWGADGSILTDGDTNLYRSAADQLKTDDKLLAALGIGVGNAVAATTPGAVVKKMEVFDASGVSLGFVPIYGAIT